VNVIAMDSDGVQPVRTVLIEGDRIAAVGLVDSHVHLEGGWLGIRWL
jgi:hypothetical protein